MTQPLPFQRKSEPLPSAYQIATEQLTDAAARIHEDSSEYPRFPWEELDNVAGLMVPEDLWVIAGRTGNGKSLFLMNLFDGLIEARHAVLYAGLEQSAEILRIKWACLRAQVKAKLILAPKQHERESAEYAQARDKVMREWNWQNDSAVREAAHFINTRFVTREDLREWTEWAVNLGCTVVIVDHVDRMKHGEGRNSFQELSDTIRYAKELAVNHRIVMILASQVGRPADKLHRYMPPALDELRGAGTKEEEADSVLCVYRPLRRGVRQAELRSVRQGLAEESTIYEPDLMAVRVLKHRLDGADALGRTALLRVQRGKVISRPLREDGQYNV